MDGIGASAGRLAFLSVNDERYGSYPEEKRNKTLELKQYFEKKSGLDIDHLNILLP
ncbi:phosphohydrolase [Treponema medium]|nr:phosphohydrolase [Treponema medium]